jgi:hypothetical protein
MQHVQIRRKEKQTMSYKKDNEPDKKEEFETPKVLNLEGKELTEEELEGAAGGVDEGHSCSSGTGNTCNGGSSGLEGA